MTPSSSAPPAGRQRRGGTADGPAKSNVRQTTRRRLTASDRKQELLDFAAELLPSVGVEGLNMAAVAARAGIGKQLVQYHFGSREELLVQLWDREAARSRAASAQLLKDSPVLEDRIRSWLSSTVADATSANILNLLSGSSEEAIRSRVYAQMIEGIQTIAQVLQDEFELPDGTAIAAAGMIGSSIVGFIPAWRVAGLSDHEGTELFVRMCVAAARAASTI